MQKKVTILTKSEKSLEEAVYEIGPSIVEFNRDQGWEDDIYGDIVYEINQLYELDQYEQSILDSVIRKFLENF